MKTAVVGLPARAWSLNERRLLLHLNRQVLGYFVDNQLEHGLVLDRQRNHGRRLYGGPCSLSATGMGLMAIAVAGSPEVALISEADAVARLRKALSTARCLTHVRGMMPHFVDSRTLEPKGADTLSTIDSSWLIAGALWASSFLQDPLSMRLANELYQRIDWRFWAEAGDSPRLVHGMDRLGNILISAWDRLNGETAFMYLLALGADKHLSLPTSTWMRLVPAWARVEDVSCASCDLGLFASQYSALLIDAKAWTLPGPMNLYEQAQMATLANWSYCQALRPAFATFGRFWGISAGDGPGAEGKPDVYRAYAPGFEVDGTAHILATVASLEWSQQHVLSNLTNAAGKEFARLRINGRYGPSSVNLDRRWRSRDVVGIDVGAAALALDNVLFANRIRNIWHRLPMVARALDRLGAAPCTAPR